MVQPGNLGSVLRHAERMNGAICQQFGTGRGTKLVIDDRHLATLLAKTQHGLGKVGATGSVDPAGAEDQVARAQGRSLLTRQLGLAVDVERSGRIGFKPGRSPLPSNT